MNACRPAKGVTPASPGDIAVQRQLRIGKTDVGTSDYFGQNVVNLDVTGVPPGPGYKYEAPQAKTEKYVYYDLATDNFYSGLGIALADGTNGLPLDIAVGGHTRISGQGKAAIAGYLDVLPWDGPGSPPEEADFGGEMTIRGTAGDPNWAMRVYKGEWHLVADVGSPYQAFTGNPTTGPTERFKFDNNGNMYVGKMYGDNNTYVPDKVDVSKGGSLVVGTGAVVRYRTGISSSWTPGNAALQAGIYSNELNEDINFVTNTEDTIGNMAFSWFAKGTDEITSDPNPAGLEMRLKPLDGLNIKDGVYIEGNDDTLSAGMTSATKVGLKVLERTWLNDKVGIGATLPEDANLDGNFLRVFGGTSSGIFDAADVNHVQFDDNLVVGDMVTIGKESSGNLLPDLTVHGNVVLDKDNGLGGLLQFHGAAEVENDGGSLHVFNNIASSNGDFFSKNGALVRYDSSSAPSFNPINPGLYSNESNFGEGVINFVTKQNDFKWYGNGYENNPLGGSGIVDEALPLMVLNPGGDSDYGKGLTITPEGGGLRVRGKLKATADMPGLWVDNETVLAKTTVIGGNLTNATSLGDDPDTLFFDESKSILVIPDNSDNNNVYMGDNLVVKDRIVVGGGLTDEPENVVALQVKKSAEIDGTLDVGEFTFQGLTDPDNRYDLNVWGNAQVKKNIDVWENAAVGLDDGRYDNELTVRGQIIGEGDANFNSTNNPKLVLKDALVPDAEKISIALGDLSLGGGYNPTLNFDFGVDDREMQLDKDGNLAAAGLVIGTKLGVAKDTLDLSAFDVSKVDGWVLDSDASNVLKIQEYKAGVVGVDGTIVELQTTPNMPQMTVSGEIKTASNEAGLVLGKRTAALPIITTDEWWMYSADVESDKGVLKFGSNGATTDVLTLTDTGNLTALNTVTGNEFKVAKAPFDSTQTSWDILLNAQDNLEIKKDGGTYLKAWDDKEGSSDVQKIDVQNLAVSSTGKV